VRHGKVQIISNDRGSPTRFCLSSKKRSPAPLIFAWFLTLWLGALDEKGRMIKNGRNLSFYIDGV
jgi:hypothetical protein